MKNKLISLCLIALLLAALPLNVSAREFDPSRQGSISISLVWKSEDVAMAGAELSVFYVASVECSADGKLVYTYTEAFSNCEFPLEDPELVAKLDAFVAEHPVECRNMITNEQGNARCEELPLGLYFVKQTGTVEGFAPCTSFLVTVPLETEGGWSYDVDASPKTDVTKLINIIVRKVWNTDEYTPISDDVTVQLRRGEIVVGTSILNEDNNWQDIYTDMPESDAYNIVEVDVPEGFIATYSQNGYIFTVTNTASLPQTGQLVWPIPVFAMAGMVFLMMGFVILRKTEKQDA